MNKNLTEFLNKTIGGISKNFDGNTIFRNGLIITGATTLEDNLNVFGKANFMQTATAAEFFEEEYSFDWTRKHLRNKIASNYGKSLVFVNRETVLEADGRLIGTGENVNGKLNVGGRRDIFQVYQGNNKTVILYRNGTVEVFGDIDGKFDRVYEWRRIVRIAVTSDKVIGIDFSGEVLIAGDATLEEQKMLDWHNIIDIKCIDGAFIGLNKDGKLISIGENTNGRLNFSEWNQIVYVEANNYYTIGINGTGSIFYTELAPEHFKLDYWEGLDFAIAKKDYIIAFKDDGNVVTAGVIPEWLDIKALYNTEYIEITDFGSFSINYDKEMVLLGDEPGFEKLKTNLTKIIELKDLPELKPVYIDHNAVSEVLIDFRELYAVKDKFTVESWTAYDNAFLEVERLLDNEVILEDEFYTKYSNLGISKNALEISALKTVMDKLPTNADQGLYSPESWENYENAKTQAENIMGDINATQEQIDQAKTALEEASSYLINVDQAKIALNNVPPSTDSYKYYPELFNSIKEQEAQLETIINTPGVTQEVIDTLTGELNVNLDLLTDISSATAIIKNTATLDPSNYNQASWQEFESARQDLETALTNQVSDQTVIDSLTDRVKAEKLELVDITSYKSFLIESQNTYPDSAVNTYTPASWEKLQTAEANLIKEMTEPTDYESLNAALIELQDAMNETVTKSGGDYWLNRAPVPGEEMYYTTETFNRAITASDDLKQLYNDPNATQEQIVAAVSELQAACTTLMPNIMTKVVNVDIKIDQTKLFRENTDRSTTLSVAADEAMIEISEIWACHNSASATVSIEGIGTLAINHVHQGEPYASIAGVPLPGNNRTTSKFTAESNDRKRKSGLVYKYEAFVRVTKVVIKYIKVKR